jgi:hypothetical protein
MMEEEIKKKHRVSMTDSVYYSLKLLSARRGYNHMNPMITQIFTDFIEAHKDELPQMV